MFLVWYWIANLAFLHPFHVSVCDITYESSDKHFKISTRMFLDDLENTMKVFTGDSKFNITAPGDSAYIHQSIAKYLKDNLEFDVDGKVYSYHYLGGEIDIDVMWCYLEIIELKDFQVIRVKNTIMTEMFNDQENLVHIRKNGRVRSLRLNNDDPAGTATWD